MRRTIFSIITMLWMAASLSAQDAATSLTKARSLMAKGQWKAAAAAIAPGVEKAAAIKDPERREQALAALHFYSAVIHSRLGDDQGAERHLNEFFQWSPQAHSIDKAKYDAKFVALFNELAPASKAMSAMSFGSVYSSFEPASLEITEPEAGTWGRSPALEILGSRGEKREWSEIVAMPDREKFIAGFWQRRDPTPGTPENEFRTTFNQRVAYADRVFGTDSLRGSATDRGRVFVLLGEPSSVRRRPLTRHDRVSVYMEDVLINGSVEQWVYGREQLPIRIGKDKVGYRFVTQAGIGDHALQREDVFAMQALIAATNPKPEP
jgi:GWxTD domain-containing protein